MVDYFRLRIAATSACTGAERRPRQTQCGRSGKTMHILNNPSKNIGRHQNNLCFWYRKRCRHIPKERYKTWLIVETWRGIDELEEIENLLQAEKRARSSK